jgi:hypothetical protein
MDIPARLSFAKVSIALLLLASLPVYGYDWKPDPTLNLQDQRVRLYKISRTYFEEHFDAKVGEEQRDMRHAHPHMTGVTLDYAYALLMTKDPKDRAFAETIIAHVLTKQCLDKSSANYGSFLPYFEDDWATAVNPDPNYGQFLGIGLANMIELDNTEGHLLTPALRQQVDDAFRLTVAFTIRRDVTPDYTNIALMSAAVAAAGDKLFAIPGARDFALSKLYWILTRTLPGSTFTEYMAPTYYGVDLAALYEIQKFAAAPEIAEPTERLLTAFWKDIAASYNPATFQLGGPQARAYGDNMLEYVASLKYFLFFALDGKYPISDKETDQTWGLSELAGLANSKIDPRPEMTEAPQPWRQVTVANRPGMIVSQYRKGDFSLGSVSAQSVWQQQRNVTAYWPIAKPWWDVGFFLDKSSLTQSNGYAHFFSKQEGSAVLVALTGKMPNPPTGGLKLEFNELAEGKPIADGPPGSFEVTDGDVTTYVYPVTQSATGVMTYTKDEKRVDLQRDWTTADHAGNIGVLSYLVVFRNPGEDVPVVKDLTLVSDDKGATASANVNGAAMSVDAR